MDCHMMVSQPEKVTHLHLSSFGIFTTVQWVNDVADAGGSLYCFHLEATSQQ